jgi:hypothetical protein
MFDVTALAILMAKQEPVFYLANSLDFFFIKPDTITKFL